MWGLGPGFGLSCCCCGLRFFGLRFCGFEVDSRFWFLLEEGMFDVGFVVWGLRNLDLKAGF